MTELRAVDGNGHVPDDGNPEANPKQTDSTLLCPYEDPALRCAWYEGYIAAAAIVAARAQAQLDAILERRPA